MQTSSNSPSKPWIANDATSLVIGVASSVVCKCSRGSQLHFIISLGHIVMLKVKGRK